MLSPRNKGAKKRFREPFGKAGLTVAILALVFAMVGGAWAAAGLNSKQKKEVKSIAKSFQGTGPAGAAGPAGAKGDNGSNGANGSKGDTGNTGTAGKNGESVKLAAATKCGAPGGTKLTVGAESKEVCNGTTGFTETLPSGETETGTWTVLQSGKWGFPEALTSISFQFPLPEGAKNAAFVFNVVDIEKELYGKLEEEGELTTAGCKVGEPECIDTGCRGSAAEPSAPAGVLCVYTKFESYEGTSGKRLRAQVVGEFNPFGYGPSGTYLLGFNSENPEAFVSTGGTWAVTAP